MMAIGRGSNFPSQGAGGFGWGQNSGMGQMLTLEQHNEQIRLSNLAQRQKAGVLCRCGTEMVFAEVHPAYDIGYGNANHMNPGEPVNVQCPTCDKTGYKMVKA